MDQAQNEDETCQKSDQLIENLYAAHFVNIHFQGLSREGKSEKGTQTSCITSSFLTLVSYAGFFVLSRYPSTHKKRLLADYFLPTFLPIPLKYCYSFNRLNQTHYIGMEFTKNFNK